MPLTLLYPMYPSTDNIVRWLPDIHRMLLFDCSDDDLEMHLTDALSAASR